MAKTWGQIVEDALTLMAISGITAPATPSDQQTMLNLARSLFPFFENKGIFLGVNYSDTLNPTSNTNMPDYYWHGFSAQLALQGCSIFGLQPTPRLAATAKEALEGMFNAMPVIAVQNPFQPAGQGDRGFYYGPRYMTQADECPDHEGLVYRPFPY